MTVSFGLLSDTHMPMRLSALPAALFEALDGIDMLLHAGDVGELSVLDELSSLAPVVAVHGNDDSKDSQASLPYSTLVTAAGTRILLWHSHHQSRQHEFADRVIDAFMPKLERISQRAREAGARVAVFGHWHIPLVRTVDGVLLINPGAVASGNSISRQLRQTVARLDVGDDGTVSARHIDLSDPHGAYDATVRWDAGFKATLSRYSDTILAPELVSALPQILAQISDEDQAVLSSLALTLAHQCWNGEIEFIDAEMLLDALYREPAMSAADKERFSKLLD